MFAGYACYVSVFFGRTVFRDIYLTAVAQRVEMRGHDLDAGFVESTEDTFKKDANK